MARLIGGALVLAALVVLGILLPVPSQPVHTTTPSPVEYFSVKYGAWGLARVRVLRFSTDEVDLRLLRPASGIELERVSRMPGCGEALACFNGPFFEEEGGRPLGLLVSEAVPWQPLRNVSWGVFWIDREGKAHITRRDAFRSVDVERQVRFAIQSGPTTLMDGEVKKKESTELARRTAIGIDGSGRVIVLVANFPVRLASLAEFAQRELDAHQLMNLDGGSSTQLVVPSREKEPKVLGFPVAVGVGLYPRATASTSPGGSPSSDSSK